ncbi:MAG: methyltransferase [Desulfuromonadales bacterium]|nr:methyltransferase [Desulfuromonadales bacterium]
MDPSSKNRLTDKELFLFPGETLFDKIGRAVCAAGCLPRKELFESWHAARQVRRRFRGGRVVDLACGHGLTAAILLLLDSSSEQALAIDKSLPPSAHKLQSSLVEHWPRLQGKLELKQADIEEISLQPTDLVVSVHACGGLTDLILDKAAAVGARVAVLPCCHDLTESERTGLEGWLDGPLAIDVARATRLQQQGYSIYTRTIPAEITPKNRLLMAERKN